MRALVTGGGGFLGRAIVGQLLNAGWSVRSFGRGPQPSLQALGVDVYQGNLADAVALEKAVAGCDAVIHTAAKAGVWGSWEDYFRPNVVGTRNVLAACHNQNVGRLVYTSTPSVVFNGQSHAGADESLPYGINFPCHYPATKAIAEKEVLSAHDPKKLCVVALRPHLIWGAGDPHLVPRILTRAHRLRIIGGGKNRVDLTHVRNAARAHVLALEALANPAHPAGGHVYFISDDAPVYLWEWINNFLGRLGKTPIDRSVPLTAAFAAGFAMECLWKAFPFFLQGEPPMTRFVATELAKDHWYDISAAKRDLGYVPPENLSAALNELVVSLK